MAYYLVRAKGQELDKLRAWLDSGEIAVMRPFGTSLNYSLKHARLDPDGWAIWEEEDYCTPPLAMERRAVLDRHFTDLTVKRVEAGDGWEQIDDLPGLWEVSV